MEFVLAPEDEAPVDGDAHPPSQIMGLDSQQRLLRLLLGQMQSQEALLAVKPDEGSDESELRRRDIPRLAQTSEQRWPVSVETLSFGRNEFGVLGLGDHRPRAEPQSVPFIGVLDLTRVSLVAAGWYHAAALTDVGLLYTWGSGADGALGHGGTANELVPRLLASLAEADPPVLCVDIACGSDLLGSHSAIVSREGRAFCWGVGTALGLGSATTTSEPRMIDPDAFGGTRIDSVACGGGFTLLLTAAGGVYSCGTWNNGRLGLGPAPKSSGLLRTRSLAKRQVPRFRLSPQRVEGLPARATALACGEAHSLVLLRGGSVWAWGKGSCGQLGLPDGRLVDSWRPAQVEGLPPARVVACGTAHSLAVDRETGSLWSWGGLGGSMLGHGSARRRSPGNTPTDGRGADAVALMKLRQPWRFPRRVECLDGLVIEHVDAGLEHSAALTTAGELYLWGYLPPRSSADGGRPGAEMETTALLPSIVGAADGHPAAQQHITALACGSQYVLAIGTGSVLAMDLGRTFQTCAFDGDDGVYGCDLTLLVGTRRLHAHKVILAARSDVLRGLIESEERAWNLELELMLPDLRYEVAVLLLEYIYGDNVHTRLDPNSGLPIELARAAETYGLPRLRRICIDASLDGDELLAATIEENARGSPSGVDVEEADRMLAAAVVPPSTFGLELGECIDSERWADVRLLTSTGEVIHAHRVVLMSRSDYFHSMLSSQSTVRRAVDEVAEVQVPDTPQSMRRILEYLYCGTVNPELSEKEILEDMIAANRYGLVRMRNLCESILFFTPNNCARILELADLLRLPRVRAMALAYAATASVLPKMHDASSFRTLAARSPHLMEELLTSVLRRREVEGRTPDFVDAETREHRAREARERREKEVVIEVHFPWQTTLICLVILVVYGVIIGNESLTWLTPYTNATGLVLALAAGLYSLGADDRKKSDS